MIPAIVQDHYTDGESRFLRQGDEALRVGNGDGPGTEQVVRSDAVCPLPDSDRVVTVSLRHANVGSTAVDRPVWMPSQNEAEN